MRAFFIWLLISTVILSALVCAYTDLLFPFNVGLALLIGFTAIILLVVALIKKSKKLTSIAVAALIGLLIAFSALNYQENARMDNAKKLISAIELYQKDHHRYPASLDILTPRYLKTIPKNPFGIMPRKYIYRVSGSNYTQKVETGKNTVTVWISSERTWDNYD